MEMDFQKLYTEFVNSTEIIRALLTGIPQEEAQVKPSPESWSILEVTCHLRDEEREDFGGRLDSILNRPDEAFVMINPQAWITERRYNEQDFEQAKAEFFARRAQSLEWIKSLAGVDWETTHTDQYGSVTAGEMFVSWIAHDNLHTRQLVELRRARIETITKPYPIEYAGEW
jgi:hypothetical protein